MFIQNVTDDFVFLR